MFVRSDTSPSRAYVMCVKSTGASCLICCATALTLQLMHIPKLLLAACCATALTLQLDAHTKATACSMRPGSDSCSTVNVQHRRGQSLALHPCSDTCRQACPLSSSAAAAHTPLCILCLAASSMTCSVCCAGMKGQQPTKAMQQLLTMVVTCSLMLQISLTALLVLVLMPFIGQ